MLEGRWEGHNIFERLLQKDLLADALDIEGREFSFLKILETHLTEEVLDEWEK